MFVLQSVRSLVLLLIATFINSCGEDKNKENVKYIIQKVDSGTPNYFLLEDSLCTAQNTLKNTSQVKIWLYDGIKGTKAQTIDLNEVNFNGLSSRAVSQSFYGGSVYIRSSGHLPLPENKFNKIRLCKKNYQRDSLESVALSAIYSLNHAWDFYFSLDSADPNLKKVVSVIHPELVQRTSEDIYLKDELITDNSLWVYSPLQGGSMILSIAHSLERDSWYPIKFWERPSVFFHEFGHHVFYHHTFLAGRNKTHGKEQFFIEKNIAFNAQDALNEGFADLFSHYSIIARLKSNYQWGCDNPRLGKCYRDVRYPYFKVARSFFPKRLSEKLLKNFLTENKNLWGTKTWKDPHLLGSIIAHSLDQILNHIFGQKGFTKKELARKKMNFLIEWLNKLRKNSIFKIDLQKDPKEEAYDFLSKSLLHAVSFFRNQNLNEDKSLNFKKTDCYLFAKYFPVFYLDWLDGKKIICS